MTEVLFRRCAANEGNVISYVASVPRVEARSKLRQRAQAYFMNKNARYQNI